jgi:hypothetical protein
LQLTVLESLPVMVNVTVPASVAASVVTGVTLAATDTAWPVVVAAGVAVTDVVVPVVLALATKGTTANEVMATRTLAPTPTATFLVRPLNIFRLPTSARDPRPLPQSLFDVKIPVITNSDDVQSPFGDR